MLIRSIDLLQQQRISHTLLIVIIYRNVFKSYVFHLVSQIRATDNTTGIYYIKPTINLKEESHLLLIFGKNNILSMLQILQTIHTYFGLWTQIKAAIKADPGSMKYLCCEL